MQRWLHHTYCTLEALLDTAKQRNEAPLLVLCDELADPHNLGAIIRTAECAGAHGVVITNAPQRGTHRRGGQVRGRCAGIYAGGTGYESDAGHSDAEKMGVWVYGAAMDGQSTIYEADFAGPTAIVIGSEGFGMSRLVEEQCDVKVRIPMKGKITSLNASAAAAVLLYEAVRQRRTTF